MKMTTQQKSFWQVLRFSIFFILFYLYLWLRIEPGIIYHATGSREFPVFFKGITFFKDFIAYPGGLVNYISAFISQFLYYTIIGPLIITAVALLITLVTRKIFNNLANTCFRILHFFPAVSLLLVYTKYAHIMDSALSLLISLLFVCIYMWSARFNRLINIFVFILLSLVLYYAAGGAFLLFALLCSIFELLIKHRKLESALCLLSALLIPYIIGSYMFQLSYNNAYLRLLPFHQLSASSGSIWPYAFYLFYPFFALLFLISPAFPRKPETDSTPVPDVNAKSNINKTKKSSYVRIFNWIYEPVVLIIIAVVVELFSFDSNAKRLLQINSSAIQGQWDVVMEKIDGLPIERYNNYVNCDLNRALFYNGRLLYDMFSYPQTFKVLFAADSPYDSPIVFVSLADFCLEIGLVNDAEHFANEASETFGEKPAFLKQLAIINIIKGRNEAAKIFLNKLSKDIIHNNWAEDILNQLKIDSLMTSNLKIQYIRSIMIDKNSTYNPVLNIEEALNDLLIKRHNVMAFEYLMAYYLMTKDLDKIAENIHRVNDFGYTNIPRHLEEAIIIYMFNTKKKVKLPGRRLNPNTEQRARKFFNTMDYYKSNQRALFEVLIRDFGDTYFFYYVSDFPGEVK